MGDLDRHPIDIARHREARPVNRDAGTLDLDRKRLSRRMRDDFGVHAPRCERHRNGLRTVDDVERDHLDA